MILKETILSAFTERGTLLKWLKKVEAALNNAVLTDISVEQISVTQIKLKFTFENGEYIESPVITLPRGDSGVGFDDASEISINDGAVNITADENGINIRASFEVAVGEEIFEIPASMYLPFKGSESIIIDVDESGNFIDVHLDADIAAKIGRALVTPIVAPNSISLVGVDASNSQTMLKIGEGLVIENGVLKLASQPPSPLIKVGTYRFNDELPVIVLNKHIEIPFEVKGVIEGTDENPVFNVNSSQAYEYMAFTGTDSDFSLNYIFDYKDPINFNTSFAYTADFKWNTLYEFMKEFSNVEFPDAKGFGQDVTITEEFTPLDIDDETFVEWFNTHTVKLS